MLRGLRAHVQRAAPGQQVGEKDYKRRLYGLTGGANEVAENSDVGAVGTDAACVYWKTKTFCEIEIDAGVVEFRQAETSGGLDAIHARRIDGPRRPMTLPRTASQFVKLLPIAFVPRVHRCQGKSCASSWMPA